MRGVAPIAIGLVALLATLTLARADGYGCSGGNGRAECGVSFSNGPFKPSGQCSTVCKGSCNCPQASCLKLVSACLVDSNTVSYQMSFDSCTSASDAAIEWVAFQGVDSSESRFTVQSVLNPRTILYGLKDTTACDNIGDASSKSTCCLQRNVNGAAQINTFTATCGTKPVIWMKDTSFNSCMEEKSIPDYLTATSGPNQCSGAGQLLSQLCGPYNLPTLDCNSLPSCSGEEIRETTVRESSTVSPVWADYSPSCAVGSICRYASNACELDAYWDSNCNCPSYNPLRYGYCRYDWGYSAGYATCACGWGNDILYFPGIYRPLPSYCPGYWDDFGRCRDRPWRPPFCKRPPCRPICDYHGCPNYPGLPKPPPPPPIKPCRGRDCPGWPGDKPDFCPYKDCSFPGGGGGGGGECHGRHCPGLPSQKPTTLPATGVPDKPSGGFGRPGGIAGAKPPGFSRPSTGGGGSGGSGSSGSSGSSSSGSSGGSPKPETRPQIPSIRPEAKPGGTGGSSGSSGSGAGGSGGSGGSSGGGFGRPGGILGGSGGSTPTIRPSPLPAVSEKPAPERPSAPSPTWERPTVRPTPSSPSTTERPSTSWFPSSPSFSRPSTSSPSESFTRPSTPSWTSTPSVSAPSYTSRPTMSRPLYSPTLSSSSWGGGGSSLGNRGRSGGPSERGSGRGFGKKK